VFREEIAVCTADLMGFFVRSRTKMRRTVGWLFVQPANFLFIADQVKVSRIFPRDELW